jgi:hypothetical protein
MRRPTPAIASVALLALALVSCRTMKLRDLDQVIPTPLVEEYAESTSEYADEGFFWIPLVLSSSESLSRISSGYQASGFYTLGPFGLIHGAKASARWAADGSRRAYSHESNWLWGILYGSEDHEALTNKGWRTASTQKVLFGLIGYGGELDGARIFYLLWIPFWMRSSEDDLAIEPDVIVPSG